MRFQRGIHYPHPPRGRGRKPYTVSEAALRQRCRNLRRTRIRSDRESLVIRLLVWQARFESGPRLSQRALGRLLGVWPSYVCKVVKQATSVGWDARIEYGRRVTLNDLADARRTTAKLRDQCLLESPRRLYEREARVMTTDEIIAEQRSYAEEWKRKNALRYDNRRRISIPILR